MRRAAKTDANQAEIIQALRRVGAEVLDLSRVGQGCPDLLVGFRGRNYLLEVKRPKAKGQRAGTLTPDQERFFSEWRGQVAIVRTVDDAPKAVGAVREQRPEPPAPPPPRQDISGVKPIILEGA
ncbi:MAG: hypothetical protein FWF99_00155 [Desulfovibrionaceae bacterium]|nr:hypothetical protein [Desulfovibrionaceae bacterium]